MFYDDQYLTINDVCTLLSCSKATAYKLLMNNSIHCFKIGRRYKVRAKEIYQFMDEHALGCNDVILNNSNQ